MWEVRREAQGTKAQSQWELGPGLKILPSSLAPQPTHREYPCSASALGSALPALALGNQRELLMALSLSTPLRSKTSDLASLFPAAPPFQCTPRALFYFRRFKQSSLWHGHHLLCARPCAEL